MRYGAIQACLPFAHAEIQEMSYMYVMYEWQAVWFQIVIHGFEKQAGIFLMRQGQLMETG